MPKVFKLIKEYFEKRNTFICTHCGHEFTIHNFLIWLFRPHLFDKWRYNKCPECYAWRWMKIVDENDELKPCKYCGGKPQLIPVGDFREYYAYRCSNCGKYHAQFGEARCTIKGAKKVWNRRADNDL